MKFRRITPDIISNKIRESKDFYINFIGLKLAMDMGWILTFISESNPTAQINLLHSDHQYIDNSNVAISIEASDVDGLYEKALAENLEVVYPLKVETWGVKRFFVKDPNGVTVNIMCHVNRVTNTEYLIQEWFEKWEKGSFFDLPISEDFKHTSPFGTIEGKKAYIDLVNKNQDKFLGYSFEILDDIYETDKACVRYIARQGRDFKLNVSEWYYIKDNLIHEIVSYYHIGEIRKERELKK
jgi:predicted enzyme related to lactoylglutathione lyase